MTTIPDDVTTRYEAVIGLEVHVELATATKMFCACATEFGGEPNSRTCPVCLGLPGSLPVPNRAAIEAAVRLGLALDCDVAPSSRFHRKNYFYPDMPKNYQISQYDVPICSDGRLEVDVDGEPTTVGITRVHMEEDTGKSLHVGGTGRIAGSDHSLIDYNRAGIPLLEIVSEPDIRSAAQARAYLAELRAIVLALGISDAKLEEGSMRCDANVSLRPRDTQAYGTRVEIKNMNSLRSLQRAVDYEIRRHTERLEAGDPVVQETRHWDEDAGATSTLRAKEEVFDYRYFPDPDLVPVEPDAARIEELRVGLPELPAAQRRRLVDDLGIEAEQARTLVGSGLASVLDDASAAGADAPTAAKWLANEITSWCHDQGIEPADAPIEGSALAELLAMVEEGTLSTKLARAALDGVLAGEGSPREVAQARGLEQVSDEGELERLVDEAIASQPEAAEKVRGGNDKAIGALVGAVMKASQGQANPQRVNELLRDRLAN
ncbi:Asp-tRNA(Asn)/Glu-tRNA(Gln) amidotransferase subunit GatB [Egibacter rhizosphaerae]|uniref:Aspartyl/glutamyl-tRNA(Asn/Gln) amidotransferase subunit B n=1 Tax=Egibacter rhizosphaerae TaxID=1670831 RepID=A0A411YCU5_9ACTN|nr:Asp-tRNA(Asn)/Glu-tRNA(Gln) amidotransferase subunit GatB [Egibacter rhizosphaerae]QBI19044.1 Asp-tRNA(Asn)/Glu-tRNA(Gln) amidotransferase subunit GatB [Egibacter rhizosphaerae]